MSEDNNIIRVDFSKKHSKKEEEASSLSYEERKALEEKDRKSNNKSVFHSYGIKNK